MGAHAADTWWQPGPITSWAYEIGAGVPSIPVTVGGTQQQIQAVDIDPGNQSGLDANGIPVSDPTVTADTAAIHAYGGHAICYVDVGTAENWRSDYSEFSSSILGSAMPDWPGENFINVSDWSGPAGTGGETLQQIMTNRFQMCVNEGFDAIEADNVDAYTDGNIGGFTITQAQEETYIDNLITLAHADGLAYFLKNEINGDSLIADEAPLVDGEIVEQCWQYSECSSLDVFAQENKPILNVEYDSPAESTLCPEALAFPMTSISTDVNVDGNIAYGCWQYGTQAGTGSSSTTTVPSTTVATTVPSTTVATTVPTSTVATTVPTSTVATTVPTSTVPTTVNTTAPPTTIAPSTTAVATVPPTTIITVPPTTVCQSTTTNGSHGYRPYHRRHHHGAYNHQDDNQGANWNTADSQGTDGNPSTTCDTDGDTDGSPSTTQATNTTLDTDGSPSTTQATNTTLDTDGSPSTTQVTNTTLGTDGSPSTTQVTSTTLGTDGSPSTTQVTDGSPSTTQVTNTTLGTDGSPGTTLGGIDRGYI